MSENYPTGEFMDKPEFKATRVAEGTGYGEGNISGLESDPADLEVADQVIESPDILVLVDVDDETNTQVSDDGCGDGRKAEEVWKFGRLLKRSLNRPKVFGGGLAMMVATRIGLGQSAGKSYEENFTETAELADKAGIDYGAHTGPTHDENDSGCGAIDKHPRALENTVIFKSQIKQTIDALGIDYEDDDFEEIIENNRAFVEANRGNIFSGKRILDIITKAGKVVKHLVSDHNERRIVLNTVEGYTVNQQLVQNATGGRVQVFATDVWRLRKIADKLGDTQQEKDKAFLAKVIYTLGVAATLTKGDLPVYVINQVNAPVAA